MGIEDRYSPNKINYAVLGILQIRAKERKKIEGKSILGIIPNTSHKKGIYI